MSDEERWNQDNRNKDMYASPTHSSFEVLDPHDPTLSRLATHLFKRTNDYLQGEIACGGDHYILLEEINRLAITKYTDLRNLAVNLNRTLTEYNDLYSTTIKPLLTQVDNIDVMVAKLEENAYRLDSYTKQLKTRIKEMRLKIERVEEILAYQHPNYNQRQVDMAIGYEELMATCN